MLQESNSRQSIPASSAVAHSRDHSGIAVPAVHTLQKNPDQALPALTPAAIKPFQLKPNNTGLPDQLKAGMEGLSGFSMDNVKVHYNSDKPAQLKALAYAQGDNIYIGPGQETHLPHEAWHVIQQKQGRVTPGLQLKDAMFNDDSTLENEADLMGTKALTWNNTTAAAGGKYQAANSRIIQAKKEIKGSRDFAGKGKLSINFEEMIKGSSGGMYGYISFEPFKDGRTADNIELVQIASMKTNDNEQQKYLEKLFPKDDKTEKEKAAPKIEESNIETEGVNPIKNMVRNDTAQEHFIDLLYTDLLPRGPAAGVPNVEMAYNAERRGKWKDPLDVLVMGKTDKVRNFHNFAHQKTVANDETEIIKIDQFPGYNKGKGVVKKTELHDFPCTSKPAEFSFQTSVDVERSDAGSKRKEYWGVVKWGFTTLYNLQDEQVFVDVVPPVTFVEGDTDELWDSRINFDTIFGNSAAWTSPEALDDIHRDLKTDRRRALDDLDKSARAFIFALGRILDEGKSDPATLKSFADLHKGNARWVMSTLEECHGADDKLLKDLKAKYDSLYAEINK